MVSFKEFLKYSRDYFPTVTEWTGKYIFDGAGLELMVNILGKHYASVNNIYFAWGIARTINEFQVWNDIMKGNGKSGYRIEV